MVDQDNGEGLVATARNPSWFFYAAWILFTTLSIPLAFLLTLVILSILILMIGGTIVVNGVRYATEDYLLIYVFIPTVGLLMGAAQYVLLRRYLPRMGAWVYATVGGWILGLLMVVIAGWLHWTDRLNTLELALLLFGLSVGVTQWLVLRKRISGASAWIVANFLGWGIMAWNTRENFLGYGSLMIVGLLPASVTAFMLWRLLSRKKVEGVQVKGGATT